MKYFLLFFLLLSACAAKHDSAKFTPIQVGPSCVQLDSGESFCMNHSYVARVE